MQGHGAETIQPMPKARLSDHLILIAGALFMLAPLALLLWGSLWGGTSLSAYSAALFSDDLFGNGVTAGDMLVNSMIVATGFALLTTGLSLLSAYALQFFGLRYSGAIFMVILLALFFPVETRVMPTFLVARDLGLLNSYGGMILPIAATGLGTLVFRLSLRRLPPELMEAARLDGAGPYRFFVDILLPLAAPVIGAVFVILFVIGWSQYLWPLMITTTGEDHYTIVRGMERIGIGSPVGMAMAVLASLPPMILLLAAARLIFGSFARLLA